MGCVFVRRHDFVGKEAEGIRGEEEEHSSWHRVSSPVSHDGVGTTDVDGGAPSRTATLVAVAAAAAAAAVADAVVDPVAAAAAAAAASFSLITWRGGGNDSLRRLYLFQVESPIEGCL